MNKNLLVVLMFPVLVMASITREKTNQISVLATYSVKNYSSSVINMIYRGNSIQNNEILEREIVVYSPQNYTPSALGLMYKKEFKKIDHWSFLKRLYNKIRYLDERL